MINEIFERYQSYKDSGIDWFGEMPAHWGMTQLKRVSKKITDGEHISPEFTDEGMPFLSAKDVRDRKVILSVNKYVNLNDGKRFRKRCNPLKGDILMVSRGATIGRIGLIETDREFCLLGSVILIKPNLSQINNLFLFYFFNISEAQKNLFLASQASAQQAIYLTDVSGLKTLIPPLSEQKAIAHYLDNKIGQIDRKIDLLTQKATLYSNLKQSLINETVTRGLDKSVPMKNSGIEWLGEVPKHWEVRRIKEVAYINKKTLTDKTPNDYDFDYIDIGSVTYRMKGFSSERITFENAPSRARRIVKKGDTIISTVRTYLKAITSIDDDVTNLIVSTGFAVVSPRKLLFSKYFSYLSTSNFIIDKICALSTGVSYPATNASVIADLLCIIPPLSEQEAIANYLDTKTAQIDQIIQTINTQIEKLKELRKTMINDVVTGKIKVV